MDVAAKDATDSAETVDVVDVTADVDAATTDVASAITAACGSSFFSVAAAVSATAVDAATTDVATTAACGSSFFSAAVVDSATDSVTDAVMDADVETAVATVDAAASYETQILFVQTDQRRGKLYPRLFYVLFLRFSRCFSCSSSCSFSFFFRKHSSSTS